MVVPVIKKMVSFIWIDAFFFTVGEHVPEILLQIEVPVPCPDKEENRDAYKWNIQDDKPNHVRVRSFPAGVPDCFAEIADNISLL